MVLKVSQNSIVSWDSYRYGDSRKTFPGLGLNSAPVANQFTHITLQARPDKIAASNGLVGVFLEDVSPSLQKVETG